MRGGGGNSITCSHTSTHTRTRLVRRARCRSRPPITRMARSMIWRACRLCCDSTSAVRPALKSFFWRFNSASASVRAWGGRTVSTRAGACGIQSGGGAAFAPYSSTLYIGWTGMLGRCASRRLKGSKNVLRAAKKRGLSKSGGVRAHHATNACTTSDRTTKNAPRRNHCSLFLSMPYSLVATR